MTIAGESKIIKSNEATMTGEGHLWGVLPWPGGTAPMLGGAPAGPRSVFADRYGWPFAALSSTYVYRDEGMVNLDVVHGIEITSLFGRPFRPGLESLRARYSLPIIPEWGLLANFAIYLSAIAGGALGVRATRVRLRSRAQCCIACGYPQHADIVRCPECGTIRKS